jgi:hypothetical protein
MTYAAAGQQLSPPMSMQALRTRVQSRGATANIISIAAEGATAARRNIANAVGYINFINQNVTPGGQMVLGDQPPPATGTPLPTACVTGGLGALLGADRRHHRACDRRSDGASGSATR